MEWMLLPYRRYADFSGRSRRKEYWMFALFAFLVNLVIMALMFSQIPFDGSTTPYSQVGPLFWLAVVMIVIWALASIVPSIAVAVRRFHDQDRSGWMILLGLIPYIGGIVVFVFMCLDGTRGPNRYGPDPKDPSSVDVFA